MVQTVLFKKALNVINASLTGEVVNDNENACI